MEQLYKLTQISPAQVLEACLSIQNYLSLSHKQESNSSSWVAGGLFDTWNIVLQ